MGCPVGTADAARDAVVNAAHEATLANVAVPKPHQSWSMYHHRLMGVMTAHGIVDATDALNAAVYTGLPLAVVCTSLDMESWGGKNMWGGDPGGDALPWQWFESPVTFPKWNVYWANVERGLVTNGCGPAQLTSKGLQEMANNRGGCWLPGPNMEVGAIFMQELINQCGNIQLAYQHYNGAGDAAVRYGENAFALYTQWHAELIAVR
jgi:hypothetical protein